MTDLHEAAEALPPLPDTSHWPTLLVCLNEATWTLAYKPDGIKGARWRCGFKSLPALGIDADRQIGTGPRNIEFVEAMR